MSDFVSVLKRTLQGLGETTPEVRQRVYDKARSTIIAKLEAMNPPPSPAVMSRQRRALEDAIAEVEGGYGKPSGAREPLDELEQVLNSLSGLKDQPPKAPSQPRPSDPVRSPVPAARPAPPISRPTSLATPTARPPAGSSVASRPVASTPPEREPAPPAVADDIDEFDTRFDDQPGLSPDGGAEGRRSGGLARLLIAAVVLAALGAGGYAGWLNRDRIGQMVAEWMPPRTEGAATPAQTDPPEQPAAPVQSQDQPQQPAPAPAAPTETVPSGPVKFTQKLNADGSEADAGPSQAGPTVGEGTSVATASPTEQTPTPPAQAEQPAAPDASQAQGESPVPAAPEPAQPDPAAAQPSQTPPPAQPAPGQPAVAVAQKAIFYEERTSNAAGSAEPGSIVWSVVQESPGADQPPEPAIRAEATIPSKDIQLRMTIRRNADKTLPASHIIEMIFITPPNFDGGGVSSVVRVALKGSEQDAGTALAGIPAKISDGFFLIALNDSQADVTQNMRLMQERSWLDVPLVYNSGRRALITMEKGIPGGKVFTDVLKAWGVQTSG